MTATPPKRSDLGVRTLSAIAMVAVSGGALLLGGLWWTVFVALVASGVLWEWRGLVRVFVKTPLKQAAWMVGGIAYIALAAAMLMFLRTDWFGIAPLLFLVGAVIATDVSAYFAGRSIGGPKIAPRISPSKTWAGLIGGMAGAALVIVLGGYLQHRRELVADYTPVSPFGVAEIIGFALAGAVIAVLAQAGDFFESWMKRRAGVKDSGKLLPGHGGLFDRLDGLLAVSFVMGLIAFADYADLSDRIGLG